MRLGERDARGFTGTHHGTELGIRGELLSRRERLSLDLTPPEKLADEAPLVGVGDFVGCGPSENARSVRFPRWGDHARLRRRGAMNAVQRHGCGLTPILSI